MFFKIREMRTKVNLDPDAVLVTQYSASETDVSYESIWKCKVSNIQWLSTRVSWGVTSS